MGSFGNFKAYEGTVSSPTTLTFPWNAYRMIITNDHASNDLTFTITGSAATLKPTETISLNLRAGSLIINGTSVPYRVWIYG